MPIWRVVGAPLGVSGIGFIDGRHGRVAAEPAGLADAAAALLADTPRALALAGEGRALARAFEGRRALAPAEALYARWVGEAQNG